MTVAKPVRTDAITGYGVDLTLLTGAAPSSLPTEFRLFALGDNKTSKGVFKLDPAGMDSIMSAYKDHGIELHLDYEHDMRKAAAWFVPEARADGIWATNVRWTAPAAELLRNKEYRYFSPAFRVDGDNRIIQIVNAALTNLPASKNQQALIAAKQSTADNSIAQRDKRETPMKFNEIIGLKEDAPEVDVEGRVVALAHTEAQLLKVTGKDNVADALGVVIAASDSATKLAAAEATIKEWEESKALEEQAQRSKDIEALINAAVLEGRVSLRDTGKIEQLKNHGQTHGVDALKGVLAMLNAAPVRRYQAPAPVDPEKARMQAVEDYKKAHPGASAMDAVVALSSERPALFEGGR